jgi:hypothetical protein
MKRNAKCIEVRSADGNLMFRLHLYDEEPAGGDNAAASASHASGSEQKNHNGNGSAGPAAMTEAQKRYLFRILADRGCEGDNALRRLQERFGVENLTDVSKREASTMIEQLLEEAEAK